MSLTRFLIRSFPDPLTESLSFWKIVHDNGPAWVKSISIKAGNPKLGISSLESFNKLLEDPTSINIPGGVNLNTLIKEEIKSSLIKSSGQIKNHVVQLAVRYLRENEIKLLTYLRSIKPLFPRFLSEYMSGTYLGITKSLVGLFQNSKTIRNIFSKRIDLKIKEIIIKSESQTITNLSSITKGVTGLPMWKCSSTKALHIHSSPSRFD